MTWVAEITIARWARTPYFGGYLQRCDRWEKTDDREKAHVFDDREVAQAAADEYIAKRPFSFRAAVVPATR